jgi:hypothetical protein
LHLAWLVRSVIIDSMESSLLGSAAKSNFLDARLIECV